MARSFNMSGRAKPHPMPRHAPSRHTWHFSEAAVSWRNETHLYAAAVHFADAIAADPAYADAHSELASAYFRSGQYELAVASFRDAEALGTNAIRVHVNIAYAYAKSGRLREARAMVREMEIPNRFKSPITLATMGGALLAIGEYDRGLDDLVRDEGWWDANLLIGSLFDPVRKDPRFRELMRRNGFLELAAAEPGGPIHGETSKNPK